MPNRTVFVDIRPPLSEVGFLRKRQRVTLSSQPQAGLHATDYLRGSSTCLRYFTPLTLDAARLHAILERSLLLLCRLVVALSHGSLDCHPCRLDDRFAVSRLAKDTRCSMVALLTFPAVGTK